MQIAFWHNPKRNVDATLAGAQNNMLVGSGWVARRVVRVRSSSGRGECHFGHGLHRCKQLGDGLVACVGASKLPSRESKRENEKEQWQRQCQRQRRNLICVSEALRRLQGTRLAGEARQGELLPHCLAGDF